MISQYLTYQSQAWLVGKWQWSQWYMYVEHQNSNDGDTTNIGETPLQRITGILVSNAREHLFFGDAMISYRSTPISRYGSPLSLSLNPLSNQLLEISIHWVAALMNTHYIEPSGPGLLQPPNYKSKYFRHYSNICEPVQYVTQLNIIFPRTLFPD